MADNDFSLDSKVQLSNGVLIPRIQYGVYDIKPEETEKVTRWALEVGYRGIDSAEWYENEREAGAAIRAFLASEAGSNAGLRREDIFFTTKLKTNDSYDATRKAITDSLDKSGLGYIDLFLLHSPYGGREKRLECWRAVEDAVAAGSVKTAGVSNYGIKHLQELLDTKPRVPPAVNQLEVHPFNTRTALTAFCRQHNIVVEAYSPLVRAERMDNETVQAVARKHQRSPAQVLLRWSLQKGYVPLPKSVRRERMVENAAVGGFSLTADDLERLDALDEYLCTEWDPTDCD